jgi:aspartyl-tRNA(Asn)/glutamyl-tRNA(Gln) amidotransferase subunit B
MLFRAFTLPILMLLMREISRGGDWCSKVMTIYISKNFILAMKTYTATIGLEVHAELNTKSKMFCGCKNDPHDGEPNAHICPVCLAQPGTLPVPNEEAIAMVLLFGQAVKAKAATFSEFDRKNYFYPDIPKAYQISQYAFPFLTGGELKNIALTRVHLEEDTARSQHEHDGASLVDFNRAGVPLMELVTEPVIHDAKTAGDFARELQLLLQTLKISGAQMERGEMRVEANISVSATAELGTKVEVKNLNSFKSVEGAIEFEIKRQTALIESGGVVVQETRGWDEVKLVTYSQRSKETAKDYRYFPDPDIPKLIVNDHEYFSEDRLSEIIPELPEEKRLKYRDLGLPNNQIEQIISNPVLAALLAQVLEQSTGMKPDVVRSAANYLTSDVLALLQSGIVSDFPVGRFHTLMSMVAENRISSRVAKDLLKELAVTDIDPELVARERGLLQTTDSSTLLPLGREVIAEHPSVVSEYLSGKESSLQFLVGQGMKKSRGAANPTLLTELLKQLLEEAR